MIRDVPASAPDRRNSAKTLARGGRIGELRALADGGDEHAARHLAAWLARHGRVDELRERVAAGNRAARWVYSDHLVGLRRFPEAIDVLQPLADAGIPGAQRRRASLLAGRGRYPEAVAQLRRAPPHWRDTQRVKAWLHSRGLAGGVPLRVRQDYLDALRRGTAAGDEEARQQLSWLVVVWWRSDPAAAVALLDDVGPSDWLHGRLVEASRHWSLDAFRATAIDLLALRTGGAHRRTRSALLLLQGRRSEAVAELRALTADGDRGAERDLAAVLAAPLPRREIRVADHPDPVHVHGLAFGPGGTTLAAWGRGVEVLAGVALWDAASGEPRGGRTLSHPYPDGVDVHSDGTVEERPARRWREYPHRLAAPDGAVVAVRTRGRVRVETRSGDPVLDLFAPGTVATAFHPDGGVLAVADAAGAHLWELATGRRTRTIATPTSALAFRPDGAVLAVADSEEGIIRLWSCAG
jgi:hypothetical protein